MTKKNENLVDEGFRVSLVERAFFDGKFEIPHIDSPDELIIQEGWFLSRKEKGAKAKRTLYVFMNMISTFGRF